MTKPESSFQILKSLRFTNTTQLGLMCFSLNLTACSYVKMIQHQEQFPCILRTPGIIQKKINVYPGIKNLSIFWCSENRNNRRLQFKQLPHFSEVHPHWGKTNSKGKKTIHFPCIYLLGTSLKIGIFVYVIEHTSHGSSTLGCSEDENYSQRNKSLIATLYG